MRAMVLDKPGQPLVLHDLPEPRPDHGQVLVQVGACANDALEKFRSGQTIGTPVLKIR